MDFQIRKGGAGDLDELVRLNRFVQELHADREPAFFRGYDEQAVREHLGACLGDPGVTFLVAVEDARSLGYVMARVQERAGHAYALPRKSLELEQLAVEPSSRNRGVGGALMDEAIALAVTLGIWDVQLSVWAFNEEARRLFVRKGFEVCLQRMRLRR